MKEGGKYFSPSNMQFLHYNLSIALNTVTLSNAMHLGMNGFDH